MTEPELQRLIAEHIRTRGVTRCPVAVSVPSQAPLPIPAEDAAAHVARFAALTAERSAKAQENGRKANRRRGRVAGVAARGGTLDGHPGGAAA